MRPHPPILHRPILGNSTGFAKGSQPARGTTQHNLSIAQPHRSPQARPSGRQFAGHRTSVATPGVAQTQLSGSGSGASRPRSSPCRQSRAGQHAVRQVRPPTWTCRQRSRTLLTILLKTVLSVLPLHVRRQPPCRSSRRHSRSLGNLRQPAIASTGWQDDPPPQPQLSPEMETPPQQLPSPPGSRSSWNPTRQSSRVV